MSAPQTSIENVGYVLMAQQKHDQGELLVMLVHENHFNTSAYARQAGNFTFPQLPISAGALSTKKDLIVYSPSARGIEYYRDHFSEAPRTVRGFIHTENAPEDIHVRRLQVVKTPRAVSLQSACDAVTLQNIQKQITESRSGWEPGTIESVLKPSFNAVRDFKVSENDHDFLRSKSANRPLFRGFVAMCRDGMGQESFIMDAQKRAGMAHAKRTPGIVDAINYPTAADALRAVSQFGKAGPDDEFFVVRADYFHGGEPLSRELLQEEAFQQATARLSPESAAVVKRLRDKPLAL